MPLPNNPLPAPPAQTAVARPSRPCRCRTTAPSTLLRHPPQQGRPGLVSSQAPNPNGIASQSPGLASATQAYPGSPHNKSPTPTGVASLTTSPSLPGRNALPHSQVNHLSFHRHKSTTSRLSAQPPHHVPSVLSFLSVRSVRSAQPDHPPQFLPVSTSFVPIAATETSGSSKFP